MKENELFHLNVTKFAGELDIAHAIFRSGRLLATVQQIEVARNNFDLPVGEDIPAEIEITGLKVLNAKEGIIRFEGGAGLCVNHKWYGPHMYGFVFVMDMKSRTGKGRLSR